MAIEDAENGTYYYNAATGATTYTQPQLLAPGWEAIDDPVRGGRGTGRARVWARVRARARARVRVGSPEP